MSPRESDCEDDENRYKVVESSTTRANDSLQLGPHKRKNDLACGQYNTDGRENTAMEAPDGGFSHCDVHGVESHSEEVTNQNVGFRLQSTSSTFNSKYRNG
jgi:hypothetical protein